MRPIIPAKSWFTVCQFDDGTELKFPLFGSLSLAEIERIKAAESLQEMLAIPFDRYGASHDYETALKIIETLPSIFVRDTYSTWIGKENEWQSGEASDTSGESQDGGESSLSYPTTTPPSSVIG